MAKTSATQIAQWKREFNEIGPDQVRSGLIVGGWDPEKRQVATKWLEHNDLANWRSEHPEDSTEGTFFLNLRNAKWWGIVTGAIFVAFAAIRLWKRF